jgi:hypothetical protein
MNDFTDCDVPEFGKKKSLTKKQIAELLKEGLELARKEHKELAKFKDIKAEDLAIMLK